MRCWWLSFTLFISLTFGLSSARGQVPAASRKPSDKAAPLLSPASRPTLPL